MSKSSKLIKFYFVAGKRQKSVFLGNGFTRTWPYSLGNSCDAFAHQFPLQSACDESQFLCDYSESMWRQSKRNSGIYVDQMAAGRIGHVLANVVLKFIKVESKKQAIRILWNWGQFWEHSRENQHWLPSTAIDGLHLFGIHLFLSIRMVIVVHMSGAPHA